MPTAYTSPLAASLLESISPFVLTCASGGEYRGVPTIPCDRISVLWDEIRPSATYYDRIEANLTVSEVDVKYLSVIQVGRSKDQVFGFDISMANTSRLQELNVSRLSTKVFIVSADNEFLPGLLQ